MIFPHETTVTPKLQQISAGIKTIPAENSTGHLFGHGLFRAIPRIGMFQKSQNDASEEEEAEEEQPRTQLHFFVIFTNLQISAVAKFDHIF